MRWEMVVWDGSEVYPAGTETQDAATSSPAGAKFFDEMQRVVSVGRILVMTTLPLPEPGRAVILCLVDDKM